MLPDATLSRHGLRFDVFKAICCSESARLLVWVKNRTRRRRGTHVSESTVNRPLSTVRRRKDGENVAPCSILLSLIRNAGRERPQEERRPFRRTEPLPSPQPLSVSFVKPRQRALFCGTRYCPVWFSLAVRTARVARRCVGCRSLPPSGPFDSILLGLMRSNHARRPGRPYFRRWRFRRTKDGIPG